MTARFTGHSITPVRDWKVCPRCGAQLDQTGTGRDFHLACPSCGFVKYDNPLPTTIGIIEDEAHRYLLLRRAQEPRRGYWDTVGGFLSSDERAEECLAREAREEIGCDLVELAPLGTYSSVYGTTGLHTIGIAFLCRLRPGSPVRLSAENSEYRWFPAAELPELAFPDGRQALKDAIEQRGG